MEYVYVARWIRKPEKDAEIRASAENVRAHWEEAALDVGLDPKVNVALLVGDKEVRVGISEQLDLVFREGGGSWQYY